MTQQEIINQLQEIFRDILDIPELELSFSTTATDIEEWDSLSHLQLIVAIEKHFEIRFTSEEMFEWKNIGDTARCIEEKL